MSGNSLHNGGHRPCPSLAYCVLRLAGPSSVASSSVAFDLASEQRTAERTPHQSRHHGKSNEGTGKATTSTQAPVDLSVISGFAFVI